MSSRNTWLRRSVIAAIVLPLIGIYITGCNCTKPSGSGAGAKVQTGGQGGPPKVYGRARFDGSSVRLDIKVTENTAPYAAAELAVSWSSHNDAELPSYSADPHGAYTHVPGEDWIVECIQPTYDKGKKYFHVKVQVNTSGGSPIQTSDRILQLDQTFSLCEPWWPFP